MNSTKNPDQGDRKPITFNEVADLTCQQLEVFVMDYLDHNLEPAQERAFAQHLSHCPGCEIYLANYQKTIQLTQGAFAIEDKSSCDDMPEALVKAILAATSK